MVLAVEENVEPFTAVSPAPIETDVIAFWLKQLSPIVVTLSGMTTLTKLLFLNAAPPMDVMLSGMSIEASSLLEKQLFGMEVKPVPSLTVSKSQLLKQLIPSDVTLFGIVISVKLLQKVKALSPIEVKLLDNTAVSSN
jgi:hypothetical protein